MSDRSVIDSAARPVVESFLASLRLGDIGACCALFSDEAVIAEADSLPFGGQRTGPEGFRSLVTEIGRIFDIKLGPPTVLGTGSIATVFFEIVLTSRRTGRSTSMPVVDVYTVEDGQVTQLDVYYKDTKAISDLELPGAPGEGDTADAA